MEWLIISCLLSGFSPAANDTIFGTYVIPEEKISLSLSPPNNYTLFVMQTNRKSGSVNSQEISRGQFMIEADTVILEDITTGKAMKLLTDNNEKLYPINVPSLDSDSEFLGQSQYYSDGKLKWEGEWRKGKKHGTWIYYDDLGNVAKTIRYKKGKEID
ncbi:MAG: toxin-antitoxin system YwqK family antitoxin [Cyclobacteriaceae bacterium]